MRSRPAFARIILIAVFSLALTPFASAQANAAPPQFSVAPGAYSSAQAVTITDATPGATIYYSTNGTFNGGPVTVYSSPVSISKSATLIAYATAPGYKPSANTVAAYYITSVPGSFLYTMAGIAVAGYSGDNGLATSAQINWPEGTAVDSAGNIYIADTDNNTIRRVDASTHIITTIAGNGLPGYTGDNNPAAGAQLWWPSSLAFDSAGNLFICDSGNHVIRRIDKGSGNITTYAGNSTATLLGDNGPATAANLGSPEGIAFDSSNNLYIAAYSRVREVAAATQTITTVAGGGSPPSGFGDGGAAVSAKLFGAIAVALDSSANLYIADQGTYSVREVDHSTQIITTFAGTTGFGSAGFSGDGGLATAAKLNSPTAIAIAGDGSVYIGDEFNWRIRRVSSGIINTIAGNGSPCVSSIEDAAEATSGSLCEASGFSFDKNGNLYYGDLGVSMVKELTASGTPPSTSAAAPLLSVAPGTYSTIQTLSITDSTPGANIHVEINPAIPAGDTAPPDYTSSVGYRGPFDLTGNIRVLAVAVAPGYMPSSGVYNTYTVTALPSSLIRTVAGSGYIGFSGMGGPATAAKLGFPAGVAQDGSGNLYIADSSSNNVVWKVSAATGNITVFAGGGSGSALGDNGPATSAVLDIPMGVAVDKAGNVYIADEYHNEVREVLASNNNIIRFAGNGSSTVTGGNNGDGGPATAAVVPTPNALAFDSAGNLYISGSYEPIRRVNASDGTIHTVAGGYNNTSVGDGGPATAAYIGDPVGLALDTHSNLYIADYRGRIRLVNAQTGIISTIAGNGNPGDSGNGLLATDAEISPESVAVDANGNVFYSDVYGDIRLIDAKTGIISRFAGMDFEGYTGDGGSALAATLCPGYGLFLDPHDNLFLPDTCGAAVREIMPVSAPVLTSPSASPVSGSTNFIWTPGTGLANFELHIGTTGPSSYDIYNSGIVASSVTSETVNIPANGVTIFVRLYYRMTNGTWQYTDYTFTEGGTPTAPALTSPTASPVSGSTQFTWTPGTGWFNYELRVGTTGASSYDIYNGTVLANTVNSVSVNIPSNGVEIYVRLYYRVYNGTWQYTDYTFTEGGTPTPPALTSPTASPVSGSTKFAWSAGTGWYNYEVHIGTTGASSYDIYNGGILSNTVTSETVNIPSNGVKIYVRLYYRVYNGTWQYTDYTFTEGGTPTAPALTSPTASPVSGSTQFTWTPGTGWFNYELRVGTTGASSYDIYNGTVLANTVNSVSVNIPSNGVEIYVRLYYRVYNGTWQYTDYTFAEGGTPTAPALTSPTASPVSGSTKFAWSAGTGWYNYEVHIGTTGASSYDVYNSGILSSTVTSETVNIPSSGKTIYVRLYYREYNGTWNYKDYTFTEGI